MKQILGILIIIVAVCSLAFFEPKTKTNETVIEQKPKIEKQENKDTHTDEEGFTNFSF